MDSSVLVQQSASGSQTTTKNPQAAVDNNLQLPANGSLQNAAAQSVSGLTALDQSGTAIPPAKVGQTSGVASTTAVVAPQPYHLTRNTLLYSSLGLVVVVFVASLIYGLTHQKG